MVLQRCFRVVESMLQGCCSSFTGVLHGSYRDVTGFLPCYSGRGELHGCDKDGTGVLQDAT